MSEQNTKMETVRSTDGVEIAYWKSGAGPPLVLVHGTSADHTRWRSVLPMLEPYFTVCAIDRRGRGGSGDAPGYSLETEFDDVAAVCDALDGPVNLLGHSFGALCSLEAALRSKRLGKLVLYEPPSNVEGHVVEPPGFRRRLEEMLDRGERETMLQTFFSELVGLSEADLNTMKADPSWEGRLKAAHTIPREFADAGYVVDPARFKNMNTPTLMLAGSESPAFLRASTDAVHAALPNSQIVVFEGQGHAANTTAPQLFADEVLRFLQG